MQLGLTDRVFLVTAASQGLGLASAQALVDEGAKVVLVARRAGPIRDATARLGGDHCALAVAGDLADPGTAQAAVDAALTGHGRLDGALISVGGPPMGTVLGTTEEAWRHGFESVFLAALRVARATVAVNPAARLAFILSTSARSPLPGMAISNGLRPGLAMLVKQLADEIGPQGGRAVGILPGSTATQRMIDLLAAAPDPQQARRQAESRIPLRRYGRPEEVGAVAAFLLSDAASYLTGALIPVDGGVTRAL